MDKTEMVENRTRRRRRRLFAYVVLKLHILLTLNGLICVATPTEV